MLPWRVRCSRRAQRTCWTPKGIGVVALLVWGCWAPGVVIDDAPADGQANTDASADVTNQEAGDATVDTSSDTANDEPDAQADAGPTALTCALGEPTSCPAGYYCDGFDGEAVGQCLPRCSASSECGADIPCMGTAVPGFCASNCDVISQVGCPPSLFCYTARPDSTVEGSTARRVICGAPGASPVGGACVSGGDCVPSTLCADNVCRRICRLGGSDCEVGEACVAPVSEIIIYGIQYGACF